MKRLMVDSNNWLYTIDFYCQLYSIYVQYGNRSTHKSFKLNFCLFAKNFFFHTSIAFFSGNFFSKTCFNPKKIYNAKD